MNLRLFFAGIEVKEVGPAVGDGRIIVELLEDGIGNLRCTMFINDLEGDP